MSKRSYSAQKLLKALLICPLILFSVSPSIVLSQELRASDFRKVFPTTTPPTRTRINESLPLVAILMEFPDQQHQLDKEKIHRMLFAPDRSVVDYFEWVSNSKFEFKQAGSGTLGWFTAPRNQAEYVAMPNGTHVRRADSIRAAKQALSDLDLDQLDKNNDKIITASELTIVLIWASGSSNDAFASVRSSEPRQIDIGNGFSINMPLLAVYEKRIGAFSSGDLSPATVAHEIAHVAFGLGDQYATSNPNDTTTESLCGFSLMANETALNAFDGVPILDAWALLQLGWTDVQLAMESTCFQLRAVEHHHKAIIIPIYNRGTTEYFIVENRFPVGTYNAGFATGLSPTGIDQGIAVWHIDETILTNNIINHRRAMRLVRATGPVPALTCLAGQQSLSLFDSSNPATGYALTDRSTPRNTRTRDGSKTGIEISSIPTPAEDLTIFIRNPYRSIVTSVNVLKSELEPLQDLVKRLEQENRALKKQLQSGDITQNVFDTITALNNAKIGDLQIEIGQKTSELSTVERDTIDQFAALPIANGCP